MAKSNTRNQAGICAQAKIKSAVAPAQNTGLEKSSASEIASFLKQAKQIDPTGNGRLIFALDATMSRQPSWDSAMAIQSEMFETAGKIGGLSVQLVYFRGFNECRASKWVANSKALGGLMTGIDCRGGKTQISKVLSHGLRESSKQRVAALVYIGDAMEENPDTLADKAAKLGLKGVRCFVFQEGRDSQTEASFREIARLSGGAFFRLDAGSAAHLKELLGAVAAYASGGLAALSGSGKKSDQLLLEQIKGE